MAGGTHVFDMIKQLRNNENLRIKKYFKKQNLNKGPSHPNAEKEIPFSEEDKATLIHGLKLNEEKQRKSNFLFMAIALFCTAIVVYLFLEVFQLLMN